MKWNKCGAPREIERESEPEFNYRVHKKRLIDEVLIGGNVSGTCQSHQIKGSCRVPAGVPNAPGPPHLNAIVVVEIKWEWLRKSFLHCSLAGVGFALVFYGVWTPSISRFWGLIYRKSRTWSTTGNGEKIVATVECQLSIETNKKNCFPQLLWRCCLVHGLW